MQRAMTVGSPGPVDASADISASMALGALLKRRKDCER